MRALVVLLLLAGAGLFSPLLNAATIEVYYAPEDLPGDKLVVLYDRARRYIYTAVYGITYPPAVKALVAAKKRGVDVRVITDREKLNDPKQRASPRKILKHVERPKPLRTDGMSIG